MASEFDVNFVPSYVPGAGLKLPDPLAGGRAQAAAANALASQPVMPNRATVFYSPTKGSYLVGGREISSRDEAGLLNAAGSTDPSQLFDSPGGDWRAVDNDSFAQFIDKIANPDLGRRFSKNFESATAGMGVLAGAGLKFVGADDVGQGLMDISNRRIQELSPYEMGVEDIDGSRSRGVTDWFAGVVGQFGPSIVETVVTAAVGAGAGALAGGGANPFSAVGGALASLSGKQAVKQALLKAAEKKLAGEAVDATEEKLLREGASLFAAAAEKNPGFAANVIYGNIPAEQFGQQAARAGAADLLKRGRGQAIAGGAGLFSAANSYAMGVSDVYREGIESGAPDRATAAALGIPYAALDLLPEFLLARRVFGDIGAAAGKKLSDQVTLRAKAGELLKRGGKGFAAGAALEGATEAGQEALLIAANPLVDWNSPEAVSRVLNSFAAGAAIGGPIGSLANLADNKEPANLLKPTANTDPAGDAAYGPEVTSPPQGGPQVPQLPAPGMQYGEFTEQQSLPSPQLALPAPPPTVIQAGPPPVQQALPAPAMPNRGARLRALGMRQGEAPVQSAPPPDPRVPAFLSERQRAQTQAQQMAYQQALSQQSQLVQQQRGAPPSDISYIPQLGSSEQVAVQPTLAPKKEKLKATRKPSKLGKAKPVEQIAPVGEQPQPVEPVAPALPEELPPEPPKPKKGLPKAKKAKDAKPSTAAPALKGAALKKDKINALKNGNATARSTTAAPAERVEKAAAPSAPATGSLSRGGEPVARAGDRGEQALKTDRDFLEAAIDEVDIGDTHALDEVLYYAYPDKDEGISPELTQRAKDYLNRTTFSRQQQARIDGHPAAKKGQQEAKPKVSETVSTDRQTTLERLMAFLDTLIQDPATLNDRSQRLMAQAKIGPLFANASAIYGSSKVLNTPYNGKSIGDYVQVDNSTRTPKASLNIQQNLEEDTYSLVAEMDRETGNFQRVRQFARGSPADFINNMSPGKLRLLVTSFLNQLHVAPKTSIYRNVEDLKARNPDLYRRAKAARKQGDFDTTKAVGYSFGDQVIIFSDFVKTEEQLKFVLAHEAIGHFGLRAVLGSGLRAQLDAVYSSDDRIRSLINNYIGMGYEKYEAIEEYLADAAAELDVSLLKKLWNAIKNALNKIGLHFEDDISRHLISQARKYVRTGEGGFFSSQAMAENMNRLQKEADEGRFSAALDGHKLGSTFISSAELGYNVLRPFGSVKDFFAEQQRLARAKGKVFNLKDVAASALEAVQTLDNKATRSEGLTRVFQLFQAQGRRARFLLSEYNNMLRETNEIKTREPHREKAGKLLAYGALKLARDIDATSLDSFGRLVDAGDFNQSPTINEDVFKKLEEEGQLKPEDFINGFEFETSEGTQTFRLADVGLTNEDVAADGKIWKIYLEQRAAVNKAAVDMLMANYEQSAAEHASTFDRLAGLRYKSPFERQDRQTLEEITKVYRQIMLEGADTSKSRIIINQASREKADKFLIDVTRAFDNEEVWKSWQDAKAVVDDANKVPPELRSYAKDLMDGIKSIRGKGVSQSNRYNIQAGIRNLGILETQVLDAERYAKRTILSSYVPFKRRGKYQLRLAAYDEDGQLVPLADDIKGVMPYYREDDHEVLQQMARELETGFAGEWKLKDIDGNAVTVTLKPEVSVSRQSVDFQGIINYNDFIYTLEKLDISLTPEARERVVEALTAQDASARRNLMRTGNPGWDPNVLRSVAEYLEMSAHIAAKRTYQNRIQDVMQHDSLWVAQDEKLRAYKQAWDSEADPVRKLRAKRDYERYAYMYRHMKAEGHTVEINGKSFPTLGQGERYRKEANDLLKWYSEQTNISDETDFLSNELGSRLKTAVVFAQLGGTVATAAVNTVSLLTHTIPFAAFYNPNLASGLGYGLGKSSRQVWRAMWETKNYGLGDIDTLKQLLASGGYTKYGLTEHEVKFLLEQTESGPLQAVLPDALLGTARGKIVDPRVQKAGQLWMSMFSYTEKLNRRVTALAVYRMEYERAIAEGRSEKAARDSAENAALRAVDSTQGEYAMFNRPKMARGNLLSYVFMYKMFPILTVQLLRRLPLKGKLMALGLILLASGLKGVPFADDLMDLLDTLLQKLGIKIGSVEAELYEFFDEILPGSSQVFMRGTLDRWTGATFSTRLGMGDLVPLSGVFKAGADPWRETQNFIGPMAGGLFGFVNSFGALAGMGVDTLGGRPSNTSLVEIMRQSPIALARALGDTLTYADNGAIVNSQGRVVDPNVGIDTLIFRSLGFYPASATQNNDLVRVGKQARDYMLEVSKSFKDAYIKASLTNNRDLMRSIEDEVERWNDDADGTGLEIKNFRESVQRAIKEAKLSAGARFLKTTPLGMRERTSEWMKLYGVDD